MKELDLPRTLDLWYGTGGLMMRTIDTEPYMRRFLDRNPGLCFVAEVEDSLVGAVICGHDGRRGYLHHLAVAPDYRRQGIGRRLATECITALADRGITRCHLFVRSDNPDALEFWEEVGWSIRDDTRMLSRNLTEDLNA
jgi:ribosomal protein S18 acetylase RimI-like enzyme